MCIAEIFPRAVFGVSVLAWMGAACSAPVPANPVFPRPTIVPVPAAVAGVAAHDVSLNGTWKIHRDPPPEYWRDEVDPASWADVAVPFFRRRGGAPRAEKPYAYKTTFTVPAGFAGHRVILRFEGVSNAARLWINGTFVRAHWGTLVPWTCDITALAAPGAEARLTLEVDDRPIGLARFVSGGGVLRDVRLLAVPPDHLTRFHVETDLDAQYRDATLRVWLAMAFHDGSRGRVRLTLQDGDGHVVPLANDIVALTRDAAEVVAEFAVSSPRTWDAEHPHLYTLEAALLDASGGTRATLSRAIGFREVEVVGNRMHVNGREVKLRGVWGGNFVADLKAINVNHTRQKWVSEELLTDADRLGLYVLDEIPVDFAKYGPESDPQCAEQWLALIAGLMERDRSHPSVITWGLGNESFHGPNVTSMFRYVQAEDRQRPAMFSWANRVPVDEGLPYSIYSSHYPNLNDPQLDLGDYNVAPWHSTSLVSLRTPRPVMPVLHDEYAHTILNEALILRDPNVRNFWGESMHRYWEKIFTTPGALGGDQFGLTLPLGRGMGPGTPEFYLTRKAHSPIRIAAQSLPNPGAGRPLEVAIKNWYDHTNLAELKVTWTAGTETDTMAGPDLAPHGAGVLRLPARAWRDGEEIALQFGEPSGNVVDEFVLVINPSPSAPPVARGPAPRLEQDAARIVITGTDFRVVFDKARGLMTEGSYRGENLIVDGPFLTLLGSGLAYGEWWCDELRAYPEGNEVLVDIRGNYAVIEASFQVRIDGTGLITTRYTIDHVPGRPPPPTFSPWDATSVGGYSEVGISYMLRSEVDRLAWQRRGLWSSYPADHIGRNTGTALRTPDGDPNAPWSRREDPAGAGSNDWRAMKENIVTASASLAHGRAALTALSDGRAAVRLAIDPGYRALPAGVRMHVHNEWNYPDFGLSNYTRPPILVRDGYTNVVYLRLESGPRRP